MESNPKTNYVLPALGSGDFPISGSVLGVQSDSISYVSKKTNLQTEAKRDVIVLQTSFGIVLCRSFNPTFDCSQLKVGDKVTFALTEYRIDNGVKSAQVRL